MQAFRAVQAANLALLGVLAGLVVALVLGAAVPRVALAGVILAQLALRAYRDWRWGGEAGRRRLPGMVLVSVLLLVLLVTAR